MIVIDTHVLVWLVQEDRRLGVAAKAVVEKERGSTGALIPAIMSWEVAMLVDKEKLALGMEAGLWFTHILAAGGFRWMALTPEIGIDAGALPGTIHGDPADRLMIATARHLDCPLVTADEKILAYAAAGHLKAIDARV
jgi:PIN domain nuclease of toxin-antitoxin system